MYTKPWVCHSPVEVVDMLDVEMWRPCVCAGTFLVWQILICVVLMSHDAGGAAIGESCARNTDCVGSHQICSSYNLCVCSENFTYVFIAQQCQADNVSSLPDLYFTSEIVFPTDMSKDDLDPARLREIKSVLGAQLIRLFINVTGFKDAFVHDVIVSETDRLLVADWTVTLNRHDQRFTGKTSGEIWDFNKADIKRASSLYRSTTYLDTSRRRRGCERRFKDLALGFGVGSGVVLLIVVLAVRINLCEMRSRGRSKDVKSSSCIISSGTGCNGIGFGGTGFSGTVFNSGYSKLDSHFYQYSRSIEKDFVVPPTNSVLSHPLVSESQSSLCAGTDDKVTLLK